MKKKNIVISLASLLLLSGCGAQPLKEQSVHQSNAISSSRFYKKKVESDAKGFINDGFRFVADHKYSNNAGLGSCKTGSTTQYKFRGSLLRIYGYEGNNGGKFSIKIDGKDLGTIDTKKEERKYSSLLFSTSALEKGEHTLLITTLNDDWVCLDYLEVDVGYNTYSKHYNLALLGKIVCSVPNPTGGGNHDINVIRNEKVYPVGSTGFGPNQWDSFDGRGENEFYFGYTFDRKMPISKVVVQMGDTFVDGGWFKNGTLRLQILENGEWVDKKTTNDPKYPISDNRADFTASGIYKFEINQTMTKGVRLIGMAGGTSHFIALSQVEAFGDKSAKGVLEGASYRDEIIYEEENEEDIRDNVSGFDILKGKYGESYDLDSGPLHVKNTLIAKSDNAFDSYSLSVTMQQKITDTGNGYGFLLNASEDKDGRLSGFLVQPHIFKGSGNSDNLTLRTGYLINGNYEAFGEFDSKYGLNSNDYMTFDFYVKDGMCAYRINNWAIGTMAIDIKGTNVYILNDDKEFNISSISHEKYESSLGNAIYRIQDTWQGNDRYGYTKTFKSIDHSFTMKVPQLNGKTVADLRLVRFGAAYVQGQEADVIINGTTLTDVWNNPISTKQFDFADSEYMLPLEYAVSEKALNFTIHAKTAGGEYCVSDYRLIGKVDGKDMVLDSLILGANHSERKHNFVGSPSWMGAQVGFVPIANKQYLYYDAFAETADLVLPTIENNGASVSHTFQKDEKSYRVDFGKFVKYKTNGSFTSSIQLWFDHTSQPSTVVDFENKDFKTTWYIDLWVHGLDESAWCLEGTHSYKYTVNGPLSMKGNN